MNERKDEKEELKIEGQAAPKDEAPAEGEMGDLREAVVRVIRTVYDPEIPVNIYELGLIYNIVVTPDNVVEIDMTLTAPACPAAGIIPGEVEAKVRSIPGVIDVIVDVVWDPPWTQEMMSEDARLLLGF